MKNIIKDSKVCQKWTTLAREYPSLTLKFFNSMIQQLFIVTIANIHSTFQFFMWFHLLGILVKIFHLFHNPTNVYNY
jgi:hypothetical protein